MGPSEEHPQLLGAPTTGALAHGLVPDHSAAEPHGPGCQAAIHEGPHLQGAHMAQSSRETKARD